MSGKERRLMQLLDTDRRSMGYSLWGVELTSSGAPRLRIYIEAETGVTVDDCAHGESSG